MMAQRDNAAMNLNRARPLLGGLSPAQFMRRHWHKTPLLVRQAVTGVVSPLDRAALFALAAREDVESRLIQRHAKDRWTLRQGPLPRRALPPLSRPGWTLLVQGLDLHLDDAHAWLSQFDFVPTARLDDLMLSYASDGGGVGPHIDSYDVFLLQVLGRRHWRIACTPQPQWRDDVPLKMLTSFEATSQWLLEPGDMLYLPPGWAHDGQAVGGDCLTASIGFRAPRADELARILLGRLADAAPEVDESLLYRDPRQPATSRPGAIPQPLRRFAQRALARALADSGAIDRALGEWLTEPKPQVWFDAGGPHTSGGGRPASGGLALDRRTRMAYDSRHVYINGEALRAGGRDARLMRTLADRRRLDAKALAGASGQARAQLDQWLQCGWVQPAQGDDDDAARG